MDTGFTILTLENSVPAGQFSSGRAKINQSLPCCKILPVRGRVQVSPVARVQKRVISLLRTNQARTMNGRCRPSTPSSERTVQWTWKFHSPTSDALLSVFENWTEYPERSPAQAPWIRIPTEIRPDTRKLAETQIQMMNLSTTPAVHARQPRVWNRAQAQTQQTMS